MENTVKNDNNTVTWVSDTIQRLLKPFEELNLISEVDLALKWGACAKDSDYYDILNHVQALVAPHYKSNTTEVCVEYWEKNGFSEFLSDESRQSILNDMDNADKAFDLGDFRTSNNLYRKVFREIQTHGFAFRESIRKSREERSSYYNLNSGTGRYSNTPPAFEPHPEFEKLKNDLKVDRKRRQAQNRQKRADENRARSKSTCR